MRHHAEGENVMHKIMFVDDEPNVLRSLKRLLSNEERYEFLFAESGKEGLALLDEHADVSVVVSDFRMPEMNGIEFLRLVRQRCPETIRIVLSGYADTASMVEAINVGHVYRFLAKPWNDDELLVTLRNAVETYDLSCRNERLAQELEVRNQELEQLNASLEETVQERTEALELRSEVLQVAQDILDSMPVAVIGVDIEDQIVQANAAATRLLKPRGSFLGEQTSEILNDGILAFVEQVKLTAESTDLVLIQGIQYRANGQYLNNDRSRGIVITFVPLEKN